MVKLKKGNELYDIPDDLLYSPISGNVGHVWARIEGDLVRIGITDFGQKQLKEIVYVELPNLGKSVGMLIFDGETPKSEPAGVIESQKTSIEFFSPISGTVEEKNEEVEDNPGLINQDPYDDGWIFLVKPTNLEKEKEMLWTAEKYVEELEVL